MSLLLKNITDHSLSRFLATGVTGVLINLLVTWLLTEFVFSPARYFIGYIIGTALNITYNFTLHTVLTFKTKREHGRRFVLFVLFNLASTLIQIAIVRFLVSALGHEYYLVIIAGTIGMLAIVSYLFFKFSLFNERKYDAPGN